MGPPKELSLEHGKPNPQGNGADSPADRRCKYNRVHRRPSRLALVRSQPTRSLHYVADSLPQHDPERCHRDGYRPGGCDELQGRLWRTCVTGRCELRHRPHNGVSPRVQSPNVRAQQQLSRNLPPGRRSQQRRLVFWNCHRPFESGHVDGRMLHRRHHSRRDNSRAGPLPGPVRGRMRRTTPATASVSPAASAAVAVATTLSTASGTALASTVSTSPIPGRAKAVSAAHAADAVASAISIASAHTSTAERAEPYATAVQPTAAFSSACRPAQPTANDAVFYFTMRTFPNSRVCANPLYRLRGRSRQPWTLPRRRGIVRRRCNRKPTTAASVQLLRRRHDEPGHGSGRPRQSPHVRRMRSVRLGFRVRHNHNRGRWDVRHGPRCNQWRSSPLPHRRHVRVSHGIGHVWRSVRRSSWNLQGTRGRPWN